MQQDQIIPLDKNCFRISKKLETRSIVGARTAKDRAVKKIVRAVLDESLTVPQQVLALRLAMKHKSLKIHSISCGLFIDNQNNLNNHIVSNIRDTIQLARRTDQTYGRVNDDRRNNKSLDP